jgi:GTP cyclohydrolase II
MMSEYDLEHQDDTPSESSSAVKPLPVPVSAAPPLVTPSTTPGPTKSSIDPATHDDAEVLDAEQPAPPAALEALPEVNCEVRARIPTTAGQEMFLHLYHNSADNKEHLAIVFGPHIRSRSLDAPREGETEKDRMIRGAYVGKLYPGRTSSRLDQIKQDAGVPAAQVSRSPTPEAVTTEERQEKAIKVAEAQNMPAPLAPMVRIHSECYTGETVWSARCDCGEQLDEAARLMSLPFDPTDASIPSLGGVIIYLRQEGRGIGLLSKLKAYNLQDLGHDTMQANLLLRHPADARSYGLATAMLMDLGLGGDKGIRLLTNNPEKVRAVEGPGREVVVKERVPMIPLAWSSGGKEGVQGPELEKYIGTKVSEFLNRVQ